MITDIKLVEKYEVIFDLNSVWWSSPERSFPLVTNLLERISGGKDKVKLFTGNFSIGFQDPNIKEKIIIYGIYLEDGLIVREASYQEIDKKVNALITIDYSSKDAILKNNWFNKDYLEYDEDNEALIKLDVPSDPWKIPILPQILQKFLKPIKNLYFIDSMNLFSHDNIKLSDKFINSSVDLRKNVGNYLVNRIINSGGGKVDSATWKDHYYFFHTKQADFSELEMGSGVQAGRILLSILMGKLLQAIDQDNPVTIIFPNGFGGCFHELVREDLRNLCDVLMEKETNPINNQIIIFDNFYHNTVFSFPNP